MAQFDIHELVRNPKLSVSIVSARNEDPKDASIRRFKDLMLFAMSNFLVLCVFTFCSYMLLNSNTRIDDKKWATAIASSIISALLGYLTGKHVE